jgi:hypothetical protein
MGVPKLDPRRLIAPRLSLAVSGTADTLRGAGQDRDATPPRRIVPGGARGPAGSLIWILRFGVAMEFIGHGALGLNHPPAWVSYFAVLGIGQSFALRCMPFVGGLDILMGALVLILPIRAVVGWMTFWGIWTAVLRPLAHEPFWEAVERAGNYGAPLALLALLLWARETPHLSDQRRLSLGWVLRLTTALLLLGHGALGWPVHKAILAAHYAAVGLPAAIEPWIGVFEILLAAAVLVRPAAGLLWFVFAWKLATELLSPISGAPFWVFVEHGGSYAAPLALIWLTRSRTARRV